MTVSEQRLWLQSLKAGDEVVVDNGTLEARPLLHKVTKITPTQVVVGTWRFKKEDGSTFGYRGPRLMQATDQLRAAIRRNELCRYIEAKPTELRKAAVPIELLENLVTAMKAVRT